MHGLAAIASAAAHAQALPQGGQVVAGQAQIRQVSPSRLSILQTTDRAAITWQNFSIGPGDAVNIQQPGATSVSLNDVVGPSPSVIFGSLTSNGRVILTNPNGIWFGPSAQVDVAGLAAVTASPSPADVADFMGGGSLDLGIPGSATASIVNQGVITVSAAGLAAFVAPGVQNSGVIAARLGQVTLASGTTATLDFRGDGLISLAVGGETLARALGPDGTPLAAAVDNNGKIAADGGQVLLTANVAKDVVDNVINMSGVVQARAVSVAGGEIVLDGGGGNVAVSGTLDASGRGAGQVGGTVKILGDDIAVNGNTTVDVSGDAGGGTALIGGNFHGAGPEPDATAVTVSQGASILANALSTGNGGSIAIWSNDDTIFDGIASAAGGLRSGNGGYVETSGDLLTVGSAASVTTSAVSGNVGMWLLDPANLTINAASSSNTTGTSIIQPISAQNTGTIQNTTISSNLSTGNVLIETSNLTSQGSSAGNITVSSAVSWNSANTLTLQAADNIAVNAAITNAGTGGLVLQAGSAAQSSANSSGSITIGANISAGSISMTAGSSGGITINSGTLSSTGSGGQVYDSPITLGGNSTVTATGSGSITFGSTVNGAKTLTATALTGSTSFAGSVGGTTALTSLTVSGPTTLGTSTVTTTGAQDYVGAVTLGSGSTSLTTTSSGLVTLGSVSGSGDTLIVTTGGGVTMNGITVGALTLSATGAETLDAGTYDVGSDGSVYSYAGTGGVKLSGAVTMGDAVTFGSAMSATTLAGTTTVTGSTGSDTITFGGTVNGGNALTVNTSGATSFASTVGTTTALSSLTVSGATTLGSSATSIKTSAGAGVVFVGAVTLGGNITVTDGAAGDPVTFDNTVMGSGTLAVSTGTTTFDAGVSVGALTLQAASLAVSNGSIATTAGQTYSGAVTLAANTTLVDSGGSAIDFGGTVNGADALTISTSGTTSFGGTVGASTKLTSLTLSGAASFGSSASGISTSGSGGQDYLGAVTLGAANTTMSPGAANGVTFGSTVSGTGTLTVSTGTVTFDAGVAVGALSLQAASYALSSGSVATTAGQTYSGALTLASNTTLVDSGGVGIDFANTVNSAGGTAEALFVNANTGPISFAGTVGATTALGSLTLDSSGTTTLGSGITAASVATDAPGTLVLKGSTITTSAGQTYGDPATLSTGAILLTDTGASGVTFGSTVNGGEVLTINAASGPTSFANTVGATSALTSLTVSGTTTLGSSATSIKTSAGAGVVFIGAVTLGGNTTVTDGLAADPVTFESTIAGLGTLAVSTGTTILDAGVSVGALSLQAASLAVSTGSIATTAGQIYSGAVTLAANTTLVDSGGTGISFASAVNSVTGTAQTLFVNAGTGPISFASTIGATHSLAAITLDSGATTTLAGSVTAASVATNAGGTVMLSSPTVTTSAGQSYSDPVILGAGSILLTDSGSNGIVFGATLDGAGALTVNAVSGPTSFANTIGATTPLTSLTVSGTTTLGTGASSVTTSGLQHYIGAVMLGAPATTLSTTNALVTLANVTGPGDALTVSSGAGGVTLNGVTAGALTLATTGAETLNPGTYAVGTDGSATDFASAGGVKLNGAMTVDDAVTFGSGTSAVTLTANTAIMAGSSADAVTFAGTVNGAFGLVVNAPGTTSFASSVGTTTALRSLTVSGGAALGVNASAITTSGVQDYQGAVTIAAGATTLKTTNALITLGDVSAAGGALTITSGNGGVTLNGMTAGGLTLSTTGVETLNAGSYAVGPDGTPLSFTSTGGVQLGGVLTMSDAVVFGATSSMVTLIADTTISGGTGADSISFGGRLNGAFALTTNIPATTSFANTVGTTTALSSLTVSGSTTFGSGASNVMTLGAQELGGPVTLAGNTTLTTTNAPVMLGTVSGPGETLAVSTGSGSIALNGVTLGALTLATSGAEMLEAGTYAIGADGGSYSFASTGGVELGGALGIGNAVTLGSPVSPVTLIGNTTITGATSLDTVTFGGTVDGGFALTTSTSAITSFLGAVGATTPLSSLTVAGASTIEAGLITTSGAQDFASAMTLAGNTMLTTANAPVTLGTVNGPGDTLSVSTGAGAVTLSGVDVATLSIATTGTETLNGGSYSIGSGAITFSGSGESLDGTLVLNQDTIFGAPSFALTLAGPTVIEAGANDVTFAGSVDGTEPLTVTSGGAIGFLRPVGAITALASLTTNVAGAVSFGSGVGSVTVIGALTLNDPVTLGGSTSLSGGAISLGPVTGTGARLSLSSDADGVILNGLGVETLSVLSDGEETLNGGTYSVSDGAAVFAGGGGENVAGTLVLTQATTFGAPASPVTLTGATTIEAGSNPVTFGGTVDGAYGLAISSSGSVGLGGAVGASTPLASLMLSPSAGATIGGGSVATTGAQIYGTTLLLEANTVLQGETVTLPGTIESSHQTVSISGPVVLTASLAVNDTSIAFGQVTASSGPGTVNLTFNLGPTDNVTFDGDAGDPGAGRLGALTVNGGRSFTIEPGYTVFVSSGSISSGEIAFGDTLDVLGVFSISGAEAVTGDIGAAAIDIAAAPSGSVNIDATASQSISISAGTISGSYDAPAITVAAPTVTGDYDAMLLTVVGANRFDGMGTIAGLTGPAAAAQIVFVGGTAEASGMFDGLGIAAADTTELLGSLTASGIDIETVSMAQIINPLATAVTDPGETLGVGVGEEPAAGPAEAVAKDARAKSGSQPRARPILPVYDYANKFLDGTLPRR